MITTFGVLRHERDTCKTSESNWHFCQKRDLRSLYSMNGYTSWLTFSSGFHSRSCVDSVTKQTITRHFYTNNSSNHWTLTNTSSFHSHKEYLSLNSLNSKSKSEYSYRFDPEALKAVYFCSQDWSRLDRTKLRDFLRKLSCFQWFQFLGYWTLWNVAHKNQISWGMKERMALKNPSKSPF